jgi:hypothetical protein
VEGVCVSESSAAIKSESGSSLAVEWHPEEVPICSQSRSGIVEVRLS